MRAESAAPVACDWLDHTGDIGMVVRGKSPAEVFAMAGAALGELMVDPAGVTEAGSREVRVEAARLDELIVRFLNALIYLRETENFVWNRIVVDLEEPPRVAAWAFGEPYRSDRHESRGGVKAATYHQLRMGEDREGWWARIVLDV